MEIKVIKNTSWGNSKHGKYMEGNRKYACKHHQENTRDGRDISGTEDFDGRNRLICQRKCEI